MIQVTAPDGSVSTRQQTRSKLYFHAAMEIVQRYGHSTPLKKQSPMDLWLEYLGVKLDLQRRRRLLSYEKRTLYLKDTQSVLASTTNPNGTIAVAFDFINPLVHKLLHASEVIPIGRSHLFHVRKAINAAKKSGAERFQSIYLGADARKELVWWESQLSDQVSCEQHGVPFAVRFAFPTSDDTTIVHYGDASREPGNLIESGFGAWSVVDGIFAYIEGRWTAAEIAHYSINVLESFVKDAATYRFYEFARERGLHPTHSLAFTDNSTAESIAEFGRTSKDGLFALNKQRQHWLLTHSVHQSTERVASVDNDIADLLSRFDIDEALRFPADAGLETLRLELSKEQRDLSFVPPTWA
jgi:hypothetical protein